MMGMTMRVGGCPSGIGVGVAAGTLVSSEAGVGFSCRSVSNSGKREGWDELEDGGREVGVTSAGWLATSPEARLSLLLKKGISRELATRLPAIINRIPPQVSTVAARLRGLFGSD
jgi:hypothetical protein